MARFFFDTAEDGKVLRDDDGLDLPSIGDARRAALGALGDMARDELPRHECRDLSVEVRDAQGTVLKAALFLEVEQRRA